MKEHQINRLRDAMRERCVNEEVLDEVVDSFHHFSHHMPYLWRIVREAPYFNTLDEVSAFVADNW